MRFKDFLVNEELVIEQRHNFIKNHLKNSQLSESKIERITDLLRTRTLDSKTLSHIENIILTYEIIPALEKYIKDIGWGEFSNSIIQIFTTTKVGNNKAEIYLEFLKLLEDDGVIDFSKTPSTATPLSKLLKKEVYAVHGLASFINNIAKELFVISKQSIGKGEVCISVLGKCKKGKLVDLYKNDISYEVKTSSGSLSPSKINTNAMWNFVESKIKQKYKELGKEMPFEITKNNIRFSSVNKKLKIVTGKKRDGNNEDRMYTLLKDIGDAKFALSLVNGALRAAGVSTQVPSSTVLPDGTFNRNLSTEIAKIAFEMYKSQKGFDYVLGLTGPGTKSTVQTITLCYCTTFEDIRNSSRYVDPSLAGKINFNTYVSPFSATIGARFDMNKN